MSLVHLDRQLDLLQRRKITSISHLRTLLYLGRCGRCAIRPISEAIGVTPAAMTSILNTLVRTRFVDRWHDTNDRRQILLQLSPSGKEFINGLTVEPPETDLCA